MHDDPDVMKWKEAQRAGARAQRARLVQRVLPGAVVALVFGGLLGAVKWQEVARRRALDESMERDRATVVDAARVERVKATLRAALERATAADKDRAAVVAAAHATLAPSGDAGSCPLPVADLSYGTLLGLTSFSRAGQPPTTTMATTRLQWALEAVDRRVQEKGYTSGERLAAELEREADTLSKDAEPPIDFELFIEEEAQPRLLGDGFVPGFVRGTLYAYERKTKTVPCAASLRAESSSSVSVITKTNDPARSPDDPESKVRADLLRNLMADAATQLVAVAPRRPPPEAPPPAPQRPPATRRRPRK